MFVLNMTCFDYAFNESKLADISHSLENKFACFAVFRVNIVLIEIIKSLYHSIDARLEGRYLNPYRVDDKTMQIDNVRVTSGLSSIKMNHNIE